MALLVVPHRLGGLVEEEGRRDGGREDELLRQRRAAAPLRVCEGTGARGDAWEAASATKVLCVCRRVSVVGRTQ